MEQEAVEIRREVAGLGARGRGFRYPSGLKARIGAYVRARRAQGASQQAVAGELGMAWATLARWSEPEGSPSQTLSLVPVHVTAGAVWRGAGEGLALVCPGGFRLEGLSVEAAVEVLRGLWR